MDLATTLLAFAGLQPRAIQASPHLAHTSLYTRGGAFGDGDAFLIRFDTSGKRKWGTYYGGSGDDRASDINFGAEGEVYYAGTTNSSTNIATTGTHQSFFTPFGNSSVNANQDAFLVRFDTSGKRKWGTYFGGTGMEDGSPWVANPASGPYIATNGCGDIYMAGGSMSNTQVATPDGYDTSRHSTTSYDIYIAQFSKKDGAQRWGSYYGNTHFKIVPTGMTVDIGGNVFVTGGEAYAGNGTPIHPPSAYDLATPGSYMELPHYNLGYWGDETDGWILRWQEVAIGGFPDTLSVCDWLTFDLPYTVSDTFRFNNVFSVELSDSTGSFYNSVPLILGTRQDSVGGTIHCVLPAGLVPGYYQFRVTTSNPKSSGACWHVLKYDKTPPPPLVLSPVEYCKGKKPDSLKATAGAPGLKLLWYSNLTSQPQFTAPVPLTTMTGTTTWYVAQLSKLGICKSAKDSIKVHVYPIPGASFEVADTVLCAGGQTQVHFTDSLYPGNVYNWNFGGIQLLSGTAEGPYTITTPIPGRYFISLSVQNHMCKSKPDTVGIFVAPAVKLKTQYEAKNYCLGDSFTISVTGASRYAWSIPGAYTSNSRSTDSVIYTTAENGRYIVSGISEYGCKGNDTAVLNPTSCCADPFMPNAFTPNGDGKNDRYNPVLRDHERLTQLRIFNRWGECVYQAWQSALGWDGNYEGAPAELGTYYYLLSGTCYDGKGINMKGDFLLIR